MSKVRTILPAVAIGALLALPAPASAVDTDNRCLVWADRYRLVEQSRFALVFSKVRDSVTFHYGCVFSQERAHALPGEGEFSTLSLFQLDGRFIAYAQTSRDEATTERADDIFVVDLKLGLTKLREPAWPDQPTDPADVFPGRGFTDQVTSLTLKANGSVAWIGRIVPEIGDENYSVQKFGDKEDVGKQELDRGPDIGPRSLAKARDELTIYWTRGAQPKTAPLR